MKYPKNNPDVAVKARLELTEEEITSLMKQSKKDRNSVGKTQYQRLLNDEELTYREAIMAKCYDCDGGHTGGLYDCEVVSCPLHIYMPYFNKLSPYSKKKKRGVSHEQ